MTKRLTIAALAALAAGLLALAACGGRGDDQLGDNAAAVANGKADALEAQADNLEAQADNLRDDGERREEAIDGGDVDAIQLNAADKAQFANSL